MVDQPQLYNPQPLVWPGDLPENGGTGGGSTPSPSPTPTPSTNPGGANLKLPWEDQSGQPSKSSTDDQQSQAFQDAITKRQGNQAIPDQGAASDALHPFKVDQSKLSSFNPGEMVGDMVKGAAHNLIGEGQEILRLGAKAVLLNAGEHPDYSNPMVQGLTQLSQIDIPKPDADTTVGRVTGSIVGFVAGMAGVGKYTAALGVLKGAPALVKGAVDAGVTGAALYDPYEARLSNLMQAHPSLANPISGFLAADPSDQETTARFKAFLENAGLGVAGEALFRVIGAIRQARPLAAAGKGTQAASIVDQAAQDAHAGKPLEPTPTPSTDPTPAPSINLNGGEPATQPVKDFVSTIADMASKGKLDDMGSVIGKDFNLSHFTSTPAAAVIDKMSQNLTPEAITQVETRKTTADLANLLASDPQNVVMALTQHAATAEESARVLVAGKQYLQFLGQNISDLAKTYNLKVANAQDASGELAQAQALAGHMNDIQSQVKLIQKGAARATGAGNIDIAPLKLDPETMNLLGMTNSPDEVGAVLRGQGVINTGIRMANELKINALLSGFRSIGTHIAGVAVNSVMLPIEKYAIGGVLSGNKDMLTQGAGYAMGLAQSFLDATKLTARALMSDAPILEGGGLVEHAPAITPEAFGVQDANCYMGQMISGVGKFVRIPTRLRMGLDEFAKQMNYRAFVTGKAFQEGVTNGLSGEDLANHIQDQLANSFASNGAGTNPEASSWAMQSTFTQPLKPGSVAQLLSSAASQHPFIKQIVPFIKVPVNLLSSGAWERAPGLNLLKNSYRDAFMGKAGPDAQALARGKMFTGMALVGTASYLAASGKLTGSGPANRDAKMALRDTGWQPYSVKMEDGTYVSYARAEPYATLFGTIADVTDILGKTSNSTDGDVATALCVAVATNLNSKLYLQGLAQGLDAMSSPSTNFNRWMDRSVGAFVPTALGDGAQAIGQGDPYLREVKSMADSIRSRIPGLSESLPPVRNTYGEPIQNPIGLPWNVVSPFTVTHGSTDPVMQETSRLGYGFTELPWKIGNLKLSPQERDQWGQLMATEKIGGLTFKERVAQLIQSPAYKNLTDGSDAYRGSKVVAIDDMKRTYEDECRQKLLQQNKGLGEAVRQDKINTYRSQMTPGLTVPTVPHPANGGQP